MLVVYGKGPSARALAEALDCPRFSPEATRNRPGRHHVVNWGSIYEPVRAASLNQRIVFDKLRQLQLMRNSTPVIPTPNFWTSPPSPSEGLSLLGRRRRHVGGRDIRLIEPTTSQSRREQRPCQCQCGHSHSIEVVTPGTSTYPSCTADYFTQYIKKEREFRVHVFKGAVLRVAEKRPTDIKDVVWNAENAHFHYYQSDGPRGLREPLVQHSIRAVAALGMDFGAVDIIWKTSNCNARSRNGGSFYVLEVNSAPSIYDNENTLAAYVQAIQRWYNEQ